MPNPAPVGSDVSCRYVSDERREDGVITASTPTGSDRPPLTAVLRRAQELASRLSAEARLSHSRALTAAEQAELITQRIRGHLKAAARHETAAQRYDSSGARWTERGEDERSDFDHRQADIERDTAQLQRERAAHEKDHSWSWE